MSTIPAQATSPKNAKAAVENFLAALDARDLQKLEALLADTATVEAPFQPSGDTSESATQRYIGRGQAMAYYKGVFERIRKVAFTQVTITPAGENTAFLEGTGGMELTSGAPYQNRYIVRFDTDNEGKILLMREYFNPVTAALAFGRPIAKSPQ